MATTLTATGMGIYRCLWCHVSFRAEYSNRGQVHECGKWCSGTPIKARLGKQDCNAKCMGSTSGVCECKCNGENHGGSL